ncbi:type I restriction enzyme, S subunit [Nitrosomonas sp. Nm51]|uniref:restriction endonuclease subunit S n=1 Tax=Nitrosomonas sp. Nm51 TaxID=133720 RepID=UPI0008D3B7C7|nr:restriction endonuclease subunit S [Nitrosomonas sp. Nm51]SER35461.1 type I restriction enzyme, S subunit [Nitrosomonas sp. Nm51]
MAVWNTVNMHEIGNHVRIEAEFYRPEYVNCQKLVESIPHTKLGLCRQKITDGTHFTPRYTETGVRFYSAVNIKDGYFAHDGPFKFISEAEHRAIHKRCPVQAGDVLLRKVGVGPRWSCVVPEGLEEFSIFVSVALIRTTGAILPEFLSMFMNCRYGQLQLLRLNKGISQPDLHLEDIGELIVPLFQLEDQQLIADCVRQSQAHRENSSALYRKAQQLLEAELGLDKLTFQRPVGYTARFSDLDTSHRSDAEFYDPELRFLWAELSKKFELRRLPEFAHVAKFANPDYGDSGVPIVTQKHLRNISPDGYGNELRTTTGWRQANPSAALQKNDLLFYSVGAYLGKTNIWLNDDEAVPASFITLLRCNEEHDAGFMHVLLNSRYGLLQSKTYQSGTSQQYIYPKDIKRFLVPNVRQDVREQVHSLVLESYAKEKESEELLEQAKARVEQLIEEAVQS